MKRSTMLLLVGLVFSGSFCRGQGSIFTNLRSDLKRADQLYEELAYAPATELYQTVLGRSKENQDDIKIKLGRCYYHLNKPQQSAYWYEQVLAKDSLLTEQDRIRFAQSLSGSQQYAKAKEQYQALEPTDRVQATIEALDNLEQFYQDSAYYQVERLSMNTGAADFSPMYYQEGLMFVSSRSHRSPVKRVYRWNQTPFLDLYYAPRDSSGQVGKVKSLAGQVNTKFHEGAVAFLDSGRQMIFTRNSFYQGQENLSSEGFNGLNLYSAERAGDGAAWTNIAPLPFNSAEYSTGHPAMSPDGKTFYFVSDAPGGVGGTDLYTSEYDSGRWSAPHNMGEPVNTPGDEMFPYVDADGTLYFASEGHPGLGGLDIFRVSPQGEPQNIGYPVNTHRDDFGIIVDEEGRSGYFASNRLNGGADDDLYFVTIDLPATLLVQGTIVDKETQEELTEVTVALKAPDGSVIDQITTGENGDFRFQVPIDTTYTLAISKDNYQPDEQRVDALSEDSLTINSALERNKIIVEGRVTDETGRGADSARVALINRATGETEDEMVVGEDGTYRLELRPEQRYEIRAGKQQYLGNVESLPTEGMEHTVITKDFVLTRVNLNDEINLDYIYYDFDEWFIRASEEKELDRLVTFMKEHPTSEVELGAHTDARGSDAYNQQLSQKRAQAAVDYIVKKGIDRNRITAKGYGEERILNGCTNGVPCTEAQHQQNRRTEFTVVRE